MLSPLAVMYSVMCFINVWCECGLTKKAEPPPTRDVNRDSGTDRANGGWLRRLVRHHGSCHNVPVLHAIVSHNSGQAQAEASVLHRQRANIACRNRLWRHQRGADNDAA